MREHDAPRLALKPDYAERVTVRLVAYRMMQAGYTGPDHDGLRMIAILPRS